MGFLINLFDEGAGRYFGVYCKSSVSVTPGIEYNNRVDSIRPFLGKETLKKQA